MHLDFANALNLVSTVTLIGALVFTGLQVRAADRARREQAAVTVIETAALSENSARFLELLSEIPDRQFGRRNETPDFSVWTSAGSNWLHGFSRPGGCSNRQRSRRWRYPRLLVAREKLVGGKAEAHRPR